jgi:excisionase family DNA binding protein
MPIKVEEKTLYSVEDLAKLLPITPLTIRRYFKKGRIKGHKIGKNWYVTKENFEVFLEGREPKS